MPPLPLPLPRYSAAEANLLNRLAGRVRDVPVRLLDADWLLDLGPISGEVHGDYRLRLDLGGAALTVLTERALFSELLRRLDPGGDLAVLPETLLLALLEAALEPVTEALEKRSGRQVRLVAAGPAQGESSPETSRLGFTLRTADGGREVHGTITVDAAGLALLADLADALPAAAAPQDWEDLPVPVRFEVGWVHLAARELAGLEPGDVVLLDETTLAGEDQLFVRVSPTAGFRARLEGPNLTLLTMVETTMTEAETEARATEDRVASLDDIEVRLTFDVGERQLSLKELRALAPGHCFDLGRELRNAVSIRANGRVVGSGELVQIEDRIGVRIMSLAPGKAAEQ